MLAGVFVLTAALASQVDAKFVERTYYKVRSIDDKLTVANERLKDLVAKVSEHETSIATLETQLIHTRERQREQANMITSLQSDVRLIITDNATLATKVGLGSGIIVLLGNQLVSWFTRRR